jgi:Arc/MetJ-type ribon-helix-helix transcriptional regulator
MKPLTVRLPESLVAQIDVEARTRLVSRSHVVRDRLLAGAQPARRRAASLDAIADLIGSVDGLPRDLSSAKNDHLSTTRRC